MKTFKFSLVLRTRENTDVFISLDDNIYGIHSKRINILYISTQNIDCGYSFGQAVLTSTHNLCFWAEIRKIMYTPVNPSFTV